LSTTRITAVYRVVSSPDAIERRAQSLAVEQSVEMPLEAISSAAVLRDIVGRVEGIADLGDGAFEVRVGLATATTGLEAGQLMSMLFGNASILEDVALADAELPADVVEAFGGPRHGLAGFRARLGVADRALTASALKPQGLTPAQLGDLASRLADGGIDLIKDDHGLADQSYSRFADRVAAVTQRLRPADAVGRYLPSLSGHLDQLRAQVRIANDHGVGAVVVAPMIVGLPAFHALVREFPDTAFMAHPALAGATRISPSLLLGTLFRLFGADATIFPTHGGRFGYSRETCGALATATLRPWRGLRAGAPVPAGGMTLDRVEEMLEFYGRDVILLIGGALLAAGSDLTGQAQAFARRVAAGC
jgi:ribulose-bisphosphate carboxylase large chain